MNAIRATAAMASVHLRALADTRAFGTRLAAVLIPGDLLVLTGSLGAGKTALVQGIGLGLGVPGPVLSPTFVIARVHRGGRLPLVHVDAYRLTSLSEVDDLDLDADADESVTAVEWGHGLVEGLSPAHVEIEIVRRHDDDERVARLVSYGPGWRPRLDALRACFATG